jgi:hypothetical protein
MPPTPAQRLYQLGDRLRAEESKPVVLPAHLVQPESSRPIIPMRREVSEVELRDWLQQIFNANPWMAFTHRNVDLISKTFLFDERIPITRNMQDLIQAVKIADAEHRLDKSAPPPPPAPPTFPDDPMKPLVDGTMPLPLDATEYEQRKGTLPQVRNLVDRLRRFEAWQREGELHPATDGRFWCGLKQCKR